MADNQQNINLDLVEQVKQSVQLQKELLAAQRKSIEEDSENQLVNEYLRDIKKGQDKYGRLSYLSIRSWKDFGNRLGNSMRVALTKSFIKKQRPGWSDEAVTKAAQRWIASGNKGLGFVITKLVPAVGLVVTILESILKILGERGKYLRSTSMLSYRKGLEDPASLFRAATLHAGYVNNPLMHSAPLFAASQEYKNAYRSIIESGIFSKLKDRTEGYNADAAITTLIRTFDDIAAQGIILGRSFQETAQLISTVGSQYFIGRGESGLRNFSYIHDVLQSGRIAGFTDSNTINLLTNYSKLNAYSNNGIFMALTDISKVVSLIGENTSGILDSASPQQIASQLQSIAGMNVSFSQFIALTKGLRSFGRNDMSNLASSYRATGQFTKLKDMWSTLKQATGEDIKTLMTIAPEYFGGLQGDIGEQIANIIMRTNGFSGEKYKGLSFADALKKYVDTNQGKSIDSDKAAQIKMYAQQQLFFEQPLQTIIGLLVSIVQSVVQIASVTKLGISKKSASDILHESTEQLQDLNKFTLHSSDI